MPWWPCSSPCAAQGSANSTPGSTCITPIVGSASPVLAASADRRPATAASQAAGTGAFTVPARMAVVFAVNGGHRALTPAG